CMKFLLAAVATLALAATTAVGQQQYPQSSYPQNQYPQTTNPQNRNTYPQNNTYPQSTYPQNTYPQNQNSYPQNNNTYPQSSTSQNSQVPQTETVNLINGNELPAGTQLTIRTNDQISADAQSAGQTFQAEVANNIVDQNGRMIIPLGSPATLMVQNTSQGTMGVGSNQVELALQSISVNGVNYTVQSNTETQAGNRGIGANKRTAEMTGGGAVLGTVIGAIAGGAKGAVLGGVLGAAGGGAAQVLTRGKQVNVPAETLLQFQLSQPVSLNGQGSYRRNQGYPSNEYPPLK
ncbi:MAG: hypothetical protein ACRD3E_18735, partial [Terriglobales bacterium]